MLMVGIVFITNMVLFLGPGSQALDFLNAISTTGVSPSFPAVRCRCFSYPFEILCSWPEPLRSQPTHYLATYSERHINADIKVCQMIPPGSSSPVLTTAPSSSLSEQLWHCHLPNEKLLTEYILNITAVHSGGSSSYLTSFLLEDIVQPDPPVNITLSPLTTKTLLVEWSPPPTWRSIDIFPLKYHIRYRWETKGNPVSVNQEKVSCREVHTAQRRWTECTFKWGLSENTKAKLKGLVPGRTYRLQVCAEEFLGLGKCSEWSSPELITMPKTQ
ncbi:PREDICTED: interleukin-27 subunit beta [Cyprinodon variegatus]|uniref:Epstein-Barr virus induced 3 n=1 Tax=Cyprinodon variegatus TaxID=28743 RepID=A0A3Q2E9S9_CYPVA|nr:PREDICTED: interleukin-27 subunit beta [Cyprinodon variegatus]